MSINGNRSMNFLLETVLSTKYNFIPVPDVYQGMNELKRREEIDLVIVDLDYHTEENRDFIQHIQTSSLYQGLPLIMLSSARSGHEQHLDQGYEFFYKPFSPMDMVSRIDELVYHKSLKVH